VYYIVYKYDYMLQYTLITYRVCALATLLSILCNKVKIHYSFAVTAELVKEFLEGKTLEERMTEKKIYIVDLTYMATIKCTADRKVSVDVMMYYLHTCFYSSK